jgi:hypothetical protein
MTFVDKNKPRLSKDQPWYFHPILFGIYPVVALLAVNINQIRPQVAIRSFFICLILAVVCYIFLFLVFRNKSISAILSTFLIVMFFSYGHIYQLIEGRSIGSLNIGQHRFLGTLWLLIIIAGVWLIVKKTSQAIELNRILNIISIILVVMPLGQIGIFEFNAAKATSLKIPASVAADDTKTVGNLDSEKLPDVYYIILDGYSRDDVLMKLYNYDNSSFYSELKQIGFVIPDCAQSNYARTALSLSSTLFMDYVQNFSPLYSQGDQTLDMPVYHEYFQHNPVRDHLTEFGYKTVAFETGYFWNEVTDADVYIVANNNPLNKVKQGNDVSEFEMMFIRTTAFRTVSELKTKFTQNLVNNIRTPEEKHHDQVVFSLDQLEQVSSLPGKKFVFAHIIAPHAPFVFSPDGRYISTGAVNPGYTNAISFINSRLITIVKSIIANSKVPPIIILQGDHGWDEAYRMDILNAYYLPDGGSKKIYDTITPVNTFRIVLNQYFGTDFPLLKDTSFYSLEETPYVFNEVAPTCSSKNNPVHQ